MSVLPRRRAVILLGALIASSLIIYLYFFQRTIPPSNTAKDRNTSTSSTSKDWPPAAYTGKKMTLATTFVKDVLEKNTHNVVIFSKSYCPYCAGVKKIFDKLGEKYIAYELDVIENGRQIQDALLDITGQSTVPNVFIKGKHIGGFTDMDRLRQTGELEKLLIS